MIVCFNTEDVSYASNYCEEFNSFTVESYYEDDAEASILTGVNVFVNHKCWKELTKNSDFSFDDYYEIIKLVRRIILAEAHTDKVLYLDEVWDKAESTLFSEDEDDFEEMYADE